ncbi:MAG: peptide chain release factor family protein [Verrucomicrobiales bacterium]
MRAPRAKALAEQLRKYGVLDEQLEEEFIRGSGPGGQKINKTASTVRLRHTPSGLEVRCQEYRSLARNRLLARQRLCELLEQQRRHIAEAAKALREKTRRQKRPRPPALKRQLLQEKRRRGALKRDRQRPAKE